MTLRFYKAFGICCTLPRLKARIAAEKPEYDLWGIHVLASLAADGAITLGDSHEYGLEVSVFDRTAIDDLILREARNVPATSLLANRRTMARSLRRPPATSVLRSGASPGSAHRDRARRIGHDLIVRAGGAHRKGDGSMRLTAVIFDWAGTVVDHGSRAPGGVAGCVRRSRSAGYGGRSAAVHGDREAAITSGRSSDCSSRGRGLGTPAGDRTRGGRRGGPLHGLSP